MALRIVVLDEDARFQTLIEHHLTSVWSDAEVVRASSLSALDDPDPMLCHICDHTTLVALTRAEGQTPFDWIAIRTQQRPDFSPIVLADPSNEHLAVKYMKAGAGDYLPKMGLKHDNIVAAVRERTAFEAARQARAGGRTAGIKSQHIDASPGFRRLRRPPPNIPGYTIKRSIGEGGIADVYLAHSALLGKDVVLKVLHFEPDMAPENEVRRRFELEYRLISSIKSLDIVSIYDYGSAPTFCYIAMEHFARGDLMSRMRQPMSAQQSLRYVRQVARALQQLHSLAIIHRDLKPGNIMLRDDDSVALIDFGMARLLDTQDRMTATGAVFGTPFYLSPEQADGRDADHRSDLYSLGVVLFELLTGKKPYTGTTAAEICAAHLNHPIPRLPAQLEPYQPIIDRLLAKDPSQRFQSAEALLDSLGARFGDDLSETATLRDTMPLFNEDGRRWSDPPAAEVEDIQADDPSRLAS